MPSLKENFDELIERVRAGRELGHVGYEPIYYLIFPPHNILDVKRSLPAWTARLRNDGWDVFQFSMAHEVMDILQNARLRPIWLAADSKAPLDWDKTNRALANALTSGSLTSQLQTTLERLKDNRKAILLVTDLEALHPYTRIGAIESQLHGYFHVPTVFFYPGERSGKTSLKFLGFYPEDGNYRSVHVGG